MRHRSRHIHYPLLLSNLMAIKYLLGLVLFMGLSLSCSNTSVSSQAVKTDTTRINLVYEFKDIMASNMVFIPGTNKVVINHAVDALIIDFKNNKIIKKIPSPEPDDLVQHIEVSKRGDRLLISTPTAAQVWDLKSLTLLASFSSAKNSRLSGLSPNGKSLIFDQKIYDISNRKVILEFEHDMVPFSLAFSDDGRYLVTDGHMSGASIVDIKSNKQLKAIFEEGMQQIRFKDNQSFYIASGSKLEPELGGYYPDAISLYTLDNLKPTYHYSSSNRISCWEKLSNNKILLTKIDGSIELLNLQLKLEQSWSLDGTVTACASGKNNQVWLASKNSGIYLFNTNTGKIINVIESVKDPAQLILSENNYLGIVKSVKDGSHINIYLITD